MRCTKRVTIQAPLEDVPAEAVSSGPGVSVSREEDPHALSKIRLGGFSNDVEVIGQEDVRVDSPTGAHGGAGQVVLEALAVFIVAHDVLAAVAAGHYVVDPDLEAAGVGALDRGDQRRALVSGPGARGSREGPDDVIRPPVTQSGGHHGFRKPRQENDLADWVV